MGRQRGRRYAQQPRQTGWSAGDDNDRGIYVMAADGSALKRITPSSAYVGMPAWSPDGAQIAALCFDPHTHSNEVCVMTADGTNLTTLTTDGGYDGRISWTR